MSYNETAITISKKTVDPRDDYQIAKHRAASALVAAGYGNATYRSHHAHGSTYWLDPGQKHTLRVDGQSARIERQSL